METSDYISLIALVASISTWVYSRHIEENIRKRADALYSFDTSTGNPLSKFADEIETICKSISKAAKVTDKDKRISEISNIQRKEYSLWSFDIISFINSRDMNLLYSIHNETIRYFDASGEIINELNEADKSEDVDVAVQKLSRIVRFYTSYVRENLASVRSSLR